jgi:small subunit ribosomal protein S1
MIGGYFFLMGNFEDKKLDNEISQEDLMEMYEESFKRFIEGEIVTGKVLNIDKESVVVDIGYKSEGEIFIDEFMNDEGETNVKVGDEVEVMVESWNEEEETVLLSRDKAKKIKIWEAIESAYNEDMTIQGTVINRIKGGFSVDVGGLQAFLPGSQADVRPAGILDDLVGELFDFKVLKYSRKRSNIVLSRRVLLEKEIEEKKQEILSKISEGSVVKGIVKNITDYGVFIDLGGVDGLLHISDITWGKMKSPSSMFKIGDEVETMILSIDSEKDRISLGKKQLIPDPWQSADEKYKIGAKVTGRVISIVDYGVFVELEEGLEGLVHVSEMSWTKKIKHPSKIVSVDDNIEIVILNIEAETRRISLGMKQIEKNPWDIIIEKYPIGTTIEGRIKNITEFGIFIGIDEGIDGLVHISDISWTKHIKHPSELYKKGDIVRAVVMEVDKEIGKFSLGIKQLTSNPWESVEQRYEVGTEVTGTITNITDFGIFVELEEGVEGLIHISELDKEKFDLPDEEGYKLGDTATAKVMNINSGDKRIGLSIKRLREEPKKFKQPHKKEKEGAPSFGTTVFGDNLKEKLTEI